MLSTATINRCCVTLVCECVCLCFNRQINLTPASKETQRLYWWRRNQKGSSNKANHKRLLTKWHLKPPQKQSSGELWMPASIPLFHHQLETCFGGLDAKAPAVAARTVTCAVAVPLAGSCVHSVASHGAADPAVVAADAGEDAGVSLHGAVVAPGNDSLQLTAAHQGAAGVPLQAPADVKASPNPRGCKVKWGKRFSSAQVSGSGTRSPGSTHLAAAGAAVHEPGADHVLGEEVGVGVPADPVVNDGLPQALQPVGVEF